MRKTSLLAISFSLTICVMLAAAPPSGQLAPAGGAPAAGAPGAPGGPGGFGAPGGGAPGAARGGRGGGRGGRGGGYVPAQSATQPSSANAPEKHTRNLADIAAMKGDIDLVFQGDSITDNWRGTNNLGKPLWDQYFAPLKAVNLGVGADKTQHVIYRQANGELDGYKAKLFVLMIGTNNLGSNTVEDIISGIKAIIDQIKDKQPQAKILLLGIFPRDVAPYASNRQLIKDINAVISKWDDGKTIYYMDIGSKLVTPEGVLRVDLYGDGTLHPNTAGYQVEIDAILPKIKELMGIKG